MQITENINGLYVLYSQVNQAYFVCWFDTVLGVYNNKADAIYWWKEWTR